MTKQEQFFYDHAGFGYNPKTETQEQGKRKTAERLARAELWAVLEGYSFRCEHDNDVDSSWCETEEQRQEFEANAWYMQMLNENGTVVRSLCACDGGEDYKRVVRAELALEQMGLEK